MKNIFNLISLIFCWTIAIINYFVLGSLLGATIALLAGCINILFLLNFKKI